MEKPIVASDLEQIGEVLRHRETAWLVKPGDPVDLAKGMMTTFQNPDLAKKMAVNARKEVLANFTWDRQVAKIIQALKEIPQV